MFKDLKYITLMQKATLFFALLIAFWIPQYRFYLSAMIVLWLFFSLLQFNYSYRIKENYSKQNIAFFSLQVLFFLIIVLGVFISDDKEAAVKVIVKKLSFFIFPILFFLSGKQFKTKKDLFLALFVAGSTIASIACLLIAFYNSTNVVNGDIVIKTTDEIGYSYFTYNLFSYFIHPAYFSMYIVFSIAISFYLKKHTSFFQSKMRQVLFYLLIAFLLFIIYLLSSRAGMVSSVLLLFWIFISFMKRYKLIYILPITIIAIIIMGYFFSKNERIIRSYKIIQSTIKEGDKSKYYPPRLILWQSATEVIKGNFWLGTGTGDAKYEMSKKTATYKLINKKMITHNAHNQFLDTFVSSGVIGFLVLLSILAYSFYIAVKNKNELFIIFLLLLSFNFLFEAMLNVISAGIIFFVYFLNYFVFVHGNDSAKNKKVKLQ